ncbi:MAG: hypothetical protein QGH94_07290 [Phycisphaerae bacterium]|jgi:hypothetical protein|nr:hypothetical protein [Phycisphaerae bacterium]MDP7287781.1 hypothetical protein [Phycisphaerae bacterium]
MGRPLWLDFVLICLAFAPASIAAGIATAWTGLKGFPAFCAGAAFGVIGVLATLGWLILWGRQEPSADEDDDENPEST